MELYGARPTPLTLVALPSGRLVDRPVERPWSLVRRAGFRFAFVYAVVCFLPFPIGVLPGTERLADLYRAGVGSVVARLGQLPLLASGSSGAARAGWGLALSLAATLVWSVLDRRARRHPRLAAVLNAYLRYVVLFSLLAHGLRTLFGLEVLLPAHARLLAPLGSASPVELLGTFLRAAPQYAAFRGALELGAVSLLLFRRSAAVGALVGLGLAVDLAVLALSSGAPGQLEAVQLLLAAALLLAPEVPWLFQLLVRGRPRPTEVRPLPLRPWLPGALLALELVVLACCIGAVAGEQWHLRQLSVAEAVRP